ncbi:MAG TPA: hypothetical protein G4N94_07200 [Caldilineae bacterium]|nr:hypothetical protein [Caldilineae bacterium]
MIPANANRRQIVFVLALVRCERNSVFLRHVEAQRDIPLISTHTDHPGN